MNPKRLATPDLRQAAVFMAAMTWQAAMRDERFPRQKR
jgi:hypothetical protein